ncbi:MAG: hypothetical protein ACYC1M_14540 [Armatimonadota bacterium]
MNENVQFALLANGLDFILSAVDHLGGDPSARDLKYATLHLMAGIELILKERLHREHWTMVFAKPEMAKLADYKTGNFQSVAFDDSIKRLTNVCTVVVSVDDQLHLRKLRDRRNRLEHFGITDSADAIKASTAKALAIVIDFIEKHLEVISFDEGDRQSLEQIRQKLNESDRFVAERWRDIKTDVDQAHDVIVCPSCEQVSLVIGENIRCRFCGYSDKPRMVLDRYVNEVLGDWHHGDLGGIGPVITCPECEQDALVYVNLTGDMPYDYMCFECKYKCQDDDLRTCQRCGEYISVDEDDGTLVCSDCMEILLNKD